MTTVAAADDYSHVFNQGVEIYASLYLSQNATALRENTALSHGANTRPTFEYEASFTSSDSELQR